MKDHTLYSLGWYHDRAEVVVMDRVAGVPQPPGLDMAALDAAAAAACAHLPSVEAPVRAPGRPATDGVTVLFNLLCICIILDLFGVFGWGRKEVSAWLQHRREVRLLKLRQEDAWLNDRRTLTERDSG